jgi:hypothetical protein
MFTIQARTIGALLRFPALVLPLPPCMYTDHRPPSSLLQHHMIAAESSSPVNYQKLQLDFRQWKASNRQYSGRSTTTSLSPFQKIQHTTKIPFKMSRKMVRVRTTNCKFTSSAQNVEHQLTRTGMHVTKFTPTAFLNKLKTLIDGSQLTSQAPTKFSDYLRRNLVPASVSSHQTLTQDERARRESSRRMRRAAREAKFKRGVETRVEVEVEALMR